MPAPATTSPNTRPPASQQGAVLIIALVILLIMTVIGVSAMQVTVLEEKMAGGMRDKSIAFQAAESALRDGESLLTPVALPDPSSTNGWYGYDLATLWKSVDWSSGTQVLTYGGTTLDNVASPPKYIIEQLRPSPPSLEAGLPQVVDYYRITARGVGGSSNAVVVLQSIFKR